MISCKVKNPQKFDVTRGRVGCFSMLLRRISRSNLPKTLFGSGLSRQVCSTSSCICCQRMVRCRVHDGSEASRPTRRTKNSVVHGVTVYLLRLSCYGGTETSIECDSYSQAGWRFVRSLEKTARYYHSTNLSCFSLLIFLALQS